MTDLTVTTPSPLFESKTSGSAAGRSPKGPSALGPGVTVISATLPALLEGRSTGETGKGGSLKGGTLTDLMDSSAEAKECLNDRHEEFAEARRDLYFNYSTEREKTYFEQFTREEDRKGWLGDYPAVTRDWARQSALLEKHRFSIEHILSSAEFRKTLGCSEETYGATSDVYWWERLTFLRMMNHMHPDDFATPGAQARMCTLVKRPFAHADLFDLSNLTVEQLRDHEKVAKYRATRFKDFLERGHHPRAEATATDSGAALSSFAATDEAPENERKMSMSTRRSTTDGNMLLVDEFERDDRISESGSRHGTNVSDYELYVID